MSSSEITAAKALQAAIEVRRQNIITISDCTCKRNVGKCDDKCDFTPALRHIICTLLIAFTCLTGFAQQPNLYLEVTDTCAEQEYFDYTSEWAPSGYDLREEMVIVNEIDTFTGFWRLHRFFAPDRAIVLSFSNCGIAFDEVPDFGISKQLIVAPPMPSYHWSMAGQAVALPTIWIGAYYGGLAEGELTNTAGERIAQGLHPRNQQSHSYRNQATIATGIGLLTLGISCYEYERQLRKHAPRKGHAQGTDFWFSTDFWPTVGRNALFLTSAAVGGHFSAQLGYNQKVKNP